MRGDQPVRSAASPTVSPSIDRYLNTSVSMSGFGGAHPPVAVFEPDDVVELRCRNLDDRRVLERGDAVDGARREAECRARADDLLAQHRVACRAELELRPPGLD